MATPIRQRIEEDEDRRLHPRAAHAACSRGRRVEKPDDLTRTAFQVDRDRILHSKSFRRLGQKTQVFLAPEGDHYRTRLTHTLEVSQIARTLSTALGLNQDLTEAISLGHDLGHTPFGHAGESVLNKLREGGFHHAVQSLRVVDLLERDGEGLNLTAEVRDGIVQHSKGQGAIVADCSTLEAQVVRVSDLIAYLNHDLDDALRAGVLTLGDVPPAVLGQLGQTHGQRIAAVVTDVIETTLANGLERVAPSAAMLEVLTEFRAFLFTRVYDNPKVHSDFIKAIKILEELYTHMLENSAWFMDNYALSLPGQEPAALVADFIAGMTDRYALKLFEEIFMPKPWKVL